MKRLAICALVTLAVGGFGCGGRQVVTSPDDPSPKFAGTSYYEEGEVLFVSVDLRAARIGGPQNMLPLYAVIVKHIGNEQLYFGREGFVLELPDRSRIPLASYDEFNNDYGRSQADRRALGQYLDTINSKFPEPPYSWLELDFFPPRGSGIFPRETVDIRARQLVHGFLYFRLPEALPLGGRYKLLITPQQGDATYVVDFPPFENDKRSRR
jgi:hypothetical protein